MNIDDSLGIDSMISLQDLLQSLENIRCEQMLDLVGGSIDVVGAQNVAIDKVVFPQTMGLHDEGAFGQTLCRCLHVPISAIHKMETPQATRFTGDTTAFPAKFLHQFVHAKTGRIVGAFLQYDQCSQEMMAALS